MQLTDADKERDKLEFREAHSERWVLRTCVSIIAESDASTMRVIERAIVDAALDSVGSTKMEG